MSNKKVAIILALMLAIGLTGCGGNSAGAGEPAESEGAKTEAADDTAKEDGAGSSESGDKTTVRILTRYSNPDNVREKYFMDMVEKFRTENPDIDLQDISVSDENSRDTKFKTSVASGDPIEVFNFLGYAANIDYVENGVVTDLSAAMEEDTEWTRNYVQSLFGPVNYSDAGIEGIYGVPTTPYGVCVFYNKEIFDELNMELPETWEAIEEAAPALKAAGYIPMAFGAKDNYRGGHFLTALSMKKYGQDLKDKLISGDEKWNDERTVELIGYMQKLYEDGVFGENNLAYTADGELAKLESKEAAIIFSGSWNIGTISQFSNAESIVCKGFPYFESVPENKDMWMGGPDDFMAMSSKPGDADYEATLRVLKFFTSQEYWQGLYEAQQGAGTFPVTFDNVIEADALTTQFNEYYGKATNMIGEIEQYDSMAALMDIVRTELQTIFSGDDAQSIADIIQDEVDSYRASQ